MSTKTHTETALIALRQKIIGGAYAGGERLFEVALAEELCISRTPVRAALSKLAEEGLLDRAPGGGFRARRFEAADVLDTIALRGILEGTAARFAAERGIADDHAKKSEEVLRLLDGITQAERIDMASYSRENEAFHILLSQMSGSRVLIRELERVTSLPFASPSAFLDDETNAGQLRMHLSAAHREHHAMIDAIRNREGARAEALAREHARAAYRNVELLLSSEPARREGVASLAILST
jgi:GntR family transcriptional regulator of vanillate catabolism